VTSILNYLSARSRVAGSSLSHTYFRSRPRNRKNDTQRSHTTTNPPTAFQRQEPPPETLRHTPSPKTLSQSALYSPHAQDGEILAMETGNGKPAPTESEGAKTAINDVIVLEKAPRAANSAPGCTWDPGRSETALDWSEAEEDTMDPNPAFAKSHIMARTPPQSYSTPPMAPKKETALMMKLRGTNMLTATQSVSKDKAANNNAINETDNAANRKDATNRVEYKKTLADAMRLVKDMLLQKAIRSDQKAKAHDTAVQNIELLDEESQEPSDTAKTNVFQDEPDEQCKQEKTEVPIKDRLQAMENQLAILTKALIETQSMLHSYMCTHTQHQCHTPERPQTYAEAAQKNTLRTGQSTQPQNAQSNMIKVRMEKLRQERAKTEVRITLRNSNTNTKEQVEKSSEEEITNSLQNAITNEGVNEIKIVKAEKGPNYGIKIRCASEMDAEKLRSMNWKNALEGASVIETLHGAVIHGVSKYDIDFEKDNLEETKTRIQFTNSEGTAIEKIAPLRKRARNANAPTQSVVIFFKRSKDVTNCIESGIHIGRRHYNIIERYLPQCQIKQCFKCQSYGHKASACTRKAKCGKCAQEHETKECQENTMQCANCKGSHCAWSHECPLRQQKKEEGETLKIQLLNSELA